MTGHCAVCGDVKGGRGYLDRGCFTYTGRVVGFSARQWEVLVYATYVWQLRAACVLCSVT